MKISSFNRIAHSLAVVGCTVFAGSAFALSTWTTTDFDAACTSTNVDVVVAAANTWGHCGSSTPSASNNIPEFAGWSAPGSGSTFVGGTVWDYRSNGLGVVAPNESNTTGPHSIDNLNGADGIVFRFAEAVNLNNVKIGWNGRDNATGIYKDSDLSIHAWTGSGLPTLGTILGNSPTMNGWQLIGNFSNVGTLSDNKTGVFSATNQSDSSVLYSSYWLVGALNTTDNTNTKVDAFKVLAIYGSSCDKTISGTKCVTPNTNVPEPSSLALLGAAMMGFVATRRRKQKSA